MGPAQSGSNATWQAAGHKENEVLVMPPPYQVEILPIQEADPQDVVRLGFVGNLGDSADGTVENLQVGQPAMCCSCLQQPAEVLFMSVLLDSMQIV